MVVDDEFDDVYKLELIEGRFFDKIRPSDLNALVINEAAAKEYRNSESIIGSKIILNGPQEVIGVVKDFNYRSLHHKVEPLLIGNFQHFGWIDVKFEQDKANEVITAIQKLWIDFKVPDPLAYRFHDEQLAIQYSNDVQAKKLMLVLSIISIIIAAVGLYAVSVFTITQKTKEIGIHKVNGAKINELLLVINKKFLLWILMALIVSIPLSYILIDKWLQNFANQTQMSWWVFALAGLVALGIASITVSWQSIKVASRNPVEALRYE
jgi:putative ABC transport system permease protein